MIITFSGSSDDLVSVSYPGFDDEFCEEDEFLVGEHEASQGQNAYGLYVRMRYSSSGNGCWHALVSPMEEDATAPVAGIRCERYSAIVEVIGQHRVWTRRADQDEPRPWRLVTDPRPEEEE